jgi:hypothetical protein
MNPMVSDLNRSSSITPARPCIRPGKTFLASRQETDPMATEGDTLVIQGTRESAQHGSSECWKIVTTFDTMWSHEGVGARAEIEPLPVPEACGSG